MIIIVKAQKHYKDEWSYFPSGRSDWPKSKHLEKGSYKLLRVQKIHPRIVRIVKFHYKMSYYVL